MPNLSFSAWLCKQVHRDTPLGDLARDARDDKRLPADYTAAQLESHMRRVHACYEAFDALRRAERSYRRAVTC